MSTDKTLPTQSDKGRSAAEERRLRQAEALRANLARRKSQSRARTDAPAGPDAPTTAEDDAGPVE
ncbi:MAG: hypothetical protein ACM33T_12175 [Solirubrobacterales bacterium]